MKTIATLALLCFSIFAFSQVGVGNTDPKASLDISASNTATPTNEDGILIPRIDNFPSTNPGADQDGMMVFVTGNSTPSKGFYYWDNGVSNWISVTGVKKINDLEDGKTDNDGSDNNSSLFLGYNAGINDDETNNFNVGIGYQSMLNNTTGYRNTALDNDAFRDNTTGFQNTALGQAALSFNTSGRFNTATGYSALTGVQTGAFNVSIGANSGYRVFGNSSENIFIGYLAGGHDVNRTISGSIMIGLEAGYSEMNDNRLYIENSNADSDNALIYGEFDNDILRTNGQLQIGNPSTVGYTFPLTDGTAGQIMTTDGAGNVTFQNIATGDNDWTEVGGNIERQNGDVYIGNTATTNNSLYTSGTIIDWDNTNYSLDLNASNKLSLLELDGGTNTNPGLAIGDNNTGFFSNSVGTISHTGNGLSSFNIFSDGEINFRGTNSNYDFSSSNFYDNAGISMGTSNSSLSLLYGYINNDANEIISNLEVLSNNVNFTHTALRAYNEIGDNEVRLGYNSGVSNRYAVYAVSPTNYAGYFRGVVQFGTNTTNRYNMPTADGFANYVMITNGSGQLSFVNPSSIFSDNDNQQIDNFSFNSSTNILTLEIEDDGQAAQTVNLSSLNPTKSVARIYMNTSQTETGSGITKVNFDTVDFDINSDFNTTTDIFTVPADGIYRVTAQITLASSTGTGVFGVRIRVDGSQERRSEYNHHGNDELIRQVTSILNLTAGQTIDVSFARPAIGATIEANSRDSFFEIEQL